MRNIEEILIDIKVVKAGLKEAKKLYGKDHIECLNLKEELYNLIDEYNFVYFNL